MISDFSAGQGIFRQVSSHPGGWLLLPGATEGLLHARWEGIGAAGMRWVVVTGLGALCLF